MHTDFKFDEIKTDRNKNTRERRRKKRHMERHSNVINRANTY